MTTAASRTTRLDAIMVGRCQGDDTCRLSTNGNFRFLKTREIHFFSKDVYSPSVQPTKSNQVLHFALASSSLMILSVHSMIE